METNQTKTTEFFLEYLSSDGKSWVGPSANPFPSIAAAVERSKNGWGFAKKGKVRIRIKETVTTACTAEQIILVSDTARTKNAKSPICTPKAWKVPEGSRP